MNMRKTKIICTLGPAVDHAETIERLIRTGMNAARFNFSHGSHAEQLARLNMFKKVRDTLGAPVATILDTKGPEIRIKTFADGPVTLEQGQGFILTTDDVPGDGRRVSVTYANLHKEVGPGCRILVDDGLIELLVVVIVKSSPQLPAQAVLRPLHLKQLSITGAEINRLRVPPQKDSVA